MINCTFKIINLHFEFIKNMEIDFNKMTHIFADKQCYFIYIKAENFK